MKEFVTSKKLNDKEQLLEYHNINIDDCHYATDEEIQKEGYQRSFNGKQYHIHNKTGKMYITTSMYLDSNS